MNDFKPNSNKSKELAKKVLKGTIKRKGEISKIADIFITKDIDSVKDYVVHDILIPEIKKNHRGYCREQRRHDTAR